MMKLRIGFVVLLVVLAGCAAPAPAGSPTAQPTTEGEPPTDVPTTAEPVQEGVVGSIESTAVETDVVVATIALTNHGTNSTTVAVAIRYVENDSFAKVGDLTVGPGQTETRAVTLPTYGDDPANLTVQLRIDGTIVAERPAE